MKSSIRTDQRRTLGNAQLATQPSQGHLPDLREGTWMNVLGLGTEDETQGTSIMPPPA